MLKFEILLSCMNLVDTDIVNRSRIESDVLIVNQCNKDDYSQFDNNGKNVRLFSVNDKGLTKSRNFAINHSNADICLLCDDDETFKSGYEKKIVTAYERIKDADVIIFNIGNRPAPFPKKVKELCYLDLFKVSSWQISFRRKSLQKYGIKFDENMGAGTGNGAEEELKFLTDCRKAGLKVYYCPFIIADVAQEQSTWFNGFDKEFFVNRGNTTRYILGFFPSIAYALYYCLRKRKMFGKDMRWYKALKYTCQGIFENKLSKMNGKENG
ncbi:MAG: glycosyltransferase [Oscillospiraceae bacterium]